MGVFRGCARGKEPHEESRTKGGRAWGLPQLVAWVRVESGRFLGYTRGGASWLHWFVGYTALHCFF